MSYLEEELLVATGTINTSGDNEIIAGTEDHAIVIQSIVLQNESATATTMIVKDADENKLRCLGQNQGDGLAITFPNGMGLKLANDSALTINLSGANSCGYSIVYYLV